MLLASSLAFGLLVTAPASAGDLGDALVAGDAHYARRAEGAHGGVAQAAQVEAAIADYRRALALDRRSYAARLGLLRAIFFRTGFCDEMAPREKVKLLDEAKALAEETERLLETDLKGQAPAGVSHDLPVAQVRLWSAVSWGQWIVFHKLAAVWQGAPARIRNLAEAAVRLDPALDQAGGLLILGRLHVETPHILLLTGWVSRQAGIAHLRRALALCPDNPACQYFLADALLEWEPGRADEARALLQRCLTLTPRVDYAVEDAHYAEMARERLSHLTLRM